MNILRVRGYRIMMGLTQEQMAEYLGISKMSYQQKENGLSPFTVKELKAIKEKLNTSGIEVTYEELLND